MFSLQGERTMIKKKFKNKGLSVICFVLAISCAGELFVIVDELNEKLSLLSHRNCRINEKCY